MPADPTPAFADHGAPLRAVLRDHSSVGIVRRILTRDAQSCSFKAALLRSARRIAWLRLSPSPHPGGPLIGMSADRFPDSRRSRLTQAAYSRHLPAPHGAVVFAAFVPVTVAGAAPASHQLPSPANNRPDPFRSEIHCQGGDARGSLLRPNIGFANTRLISVKRISYAHFIKRLSPPRSRKIWRDT
jgi:hypothetical protein